MRRIEVNPGDRFGRLVIICESEKRKKRRMFLCECDCGNRSIVAMDKLRAGSTKSCGCYGGHGPRTHGLTGTFEYRCWEGMKKRCNNKKTPKYNRYGGRGISVCKRWMSFENFISDMGKAPSNKHSIDRIDNDGDYCPENCKWSTPSEQCRNKSNNRVVEIDGEKKTAIEWAEDLGLNYGTIISRIHRGWDDVDAVYGR